MRFQPSSKPSWSFWIFLLLAYKVSALHCHRKHDHSSDILLRKDNSQNVQASSSSSFRSEKLVQNPSESDLRDSRTRKNTNEIHTNAFCPPLDGCSCNFTTALQRLQVTCSGHFTQKFPVDQLRHDVEILVITPINPCIGSNTFCGKENHLTMGPTYQLLRQLKELRIRHSGIPNIGRKTLWGLSGLEILDLSHNSLSNVIEPNFDGLYSLKELYLDNNHIKSIVSAAFRHASRLQILSLANNRLEGLAPRVFYKLQELKILDLSHNRIQFIDGAIFVDIPDIEVFRCNDCQLFQLRTPDFIVPEKLHTLSLAQNAIQDLSEVHPNFLRKVRYLDMSDNKIREVRYHGHFDKSAPLQNLDLSHNNVSVVEDCAFCNTSLHTLNLAYNGMNSANPDMINYNLRSLRILTLSGNWLAAENLELLIEKMPNLDTLSIDQQGLVSLPPGLLKNNHQIKHLNVSANYLIDFDPVLLGYSDHIETLDLSSNYFLGFEPGFFEALQTQNRLKMVYLQNNPFVCDQCHIAPLLNWMKSSLQYWGSCFRNSNHLCLKCQKPDEYLHMPLEDLNLETLPECQDIKQAIPYNDLPHVNEEWERMKTKSNLTSYVAGGIGSLLILIILSVVLIRYRQYGVYLTHEEDQLVDGDDVLRNPVVVLDKNSESYINLRYPIHSKEDSELTKGLQQSQKKC